LLSAGPRNVSREIGPLVMSQRLMIAVAAQNLNPR
jgi:hypothetical protein